jgi:hypothetical protein
MMQKANYKEVKSNGVRYWQGLELIEERVNADTWS